MKNLRLKLAVVALSLTALSGSAHAGADSPNVALASCVDGSLLARVNLTLMQGGRVQSCVPPVDAAHMAAALMRAYLRFGSQADVDHPTANGPL